MELQSTVDSHKSVNRQSAISKGNYAKAADLVDRLGVVRPEVQTVVDRLAGIPVDIEPRFTTAAQLSER